MNYDLHTHSYFSDGELSPSALINLAKQHGVSCCALTDHDTISGLAEAQQAAKENEITFINGIEFSATWNNQLLHLVGLNFDSNNELLLSGIAQNKQRRLDRAQAMLDDFAKHDIHLQDEVTQQVAEYAVPTRPHFAQALINMGLAKDKKQAFKRYLVKGKPGFVPMQWPSIQEIGEWITSAGGIAVLAHPLRYNLTRTKLSKLIVEMSQYDIRGIEVSTAITNNQQTDLVAQLAIEHNLVASIGSDFHSLDQPWAKLGSATPLSKKLTPVWELF